MLAAGYLSHRCFHPDVPFLEAGDFYWKLKDSVAKYELLLLRTLKFKLNIQLPHPVGWIWDHLMGGRIMLLVCLVNLTWC